MLAPPIILPLLIGSEDTRHNVAYNIDAVDLHIFKSSERLLKKKGEKKTLFLEGDAGRAYRFEIMLEQLIFASLP